MATTARDSVRLASVSNDDLDTISQNIEGGRDVYRPGGFHPVYIGDVYYDEYKVPNKVGYGVYSTVWLSRDLHASADGDARKFAALKVLTVEGYGTEKDIFESGYLAGPSHAIVELSS